MTRQSVPTGSARPSSWLRRGSAGLAAALCLYLFSLTIADPDLWGHVKFGQDLLATGEIVRPDPYSFLTGGQPWINHEWLAEAVFAEVFARLGAPGLVALKTGVALLILGLLVRHLGGWGAGQAVVLLGTAGMLLPWFASIRPQMFSYLCFLLLLLLIHGAERGRTRPLWLAPALFAAWANLHGGVLAGMAMLAIWILAHLLGASLRPDLADPPLGGIGPPVLVSLSATALNPHGVWLLTFLVRTATGPRPDIAEWTPIDLMSPYGAVYLAVAATAGASLLRTRRPRRTASMLLLASAALSPFLAVRHAPLFCLAVAVLAGEHIVDGCAQAARDVPCRLRPSLAPAPLQSGVAGACALAALILLALSLPHFRCVRVRAGDFPAESIALLRRSGARGSLAIHFDWGEYAIWHLSPLIKVSDDGRRETVYPDRVRELSDRFLRGTGRWDELLADGRVDMVLVSKKFPASNLMKRAPGWRLVHEDAASALFVREGSSAAVRLGSTSIPPGPGGGCWPGDEPPS